MRYAFQYGRLVEILDDRRRRSMAKWRPSAAPRVMRQITVDNAQADDPVFTGLASGLIRRAVTIRYARLCPCATLGSTGHRARYR